MYSVGFTRRGVKNKAFRLEEHLTPCQELVFAREDHVQPLMMMRKEP